MNTNAPPSLSSFTAWFIVGLFFLGLLVDYAPRLGATVALLLVLYLIVRPLSQQGILNGKLSS